MIKVHILGVEYTVLYIQDRDENGDITEEMDELMRSGYFGMCYNEDRIIRIASIDENNKFGKDILRHEIIHAFLFQSGLDKQSADGPWAVNEEAVDWFALQFNKILEAYKEADCL